MSVSLEIRDGLAFVGLNAPPVNSLGLGVRRALADVFTDLRRRAEVQAVVLYGVGRGFSGGGDIREFGTPAAGAEPGLSQHVHPLIEDCGKPVVAAVHGFLVGGGLETALACHHRIAEAGTKVAMPEGKLGIIPLAGTQRLPRLMGLAAAFDLMLAGTPRPVEELPSLFDRIVAPGQALAAAAEFARQAATAGPPRRVRDIAPPGKAAETVLEALKQRLAAEAAPPAAWRLLEAVAACVQAASFEEGMARARAIHDALKGSPAIREARDAFFTDRTPP